MTKLREPATIGSVSGLPDSRPAPYDRFSVRALMALVAAIAVVVAVVKDATELALYMVLLLALAAMGTRWPYQTGSRENRNRDAPKIDMQS